MLAAEKDGSQRIGGRSAIETRQGPMEEERHCWRRLDEMTAGRRKAEIYVERSSRQVGSDSKVWSSVWRMVCKRKQEVMMMRRMMTMTGWEGGRRSDA